MLGLQKARPAGPGSAGNCQVTPFVSIPKRALRGRSFVPGDKSISHRALMLAAVAVGRSRISGLLEGEDVLRTAAGLRALGAAIVREGDGVYRVDGVGVGGLMESESVLDLGNSGTGARLLIGLVATHPFTSFFTGDASLCRRPMGRVTAPLSRMGAAFVSRDGKLPLTCMGARMPIPIVETMSVASAQVKSAILLAGLNAPGETTVIEPARTRDHTEILLRHFGAAVRSEDLADKDVDETKLNHAVSVLGQPELVARDVTVPGDPSSAAFPIVAALLAEDGDVTIENVCVNPLRIGLYETLKEMGADITFENERRQGGEPIADIHARSSRLAGVNVPASRAPAMIDEYPILAVAAAFAEGETAMQGLSELRVKESDRLGAIAKGLAAAGANVEASGDALTVRGSGSRPAGGAAIETGLDHRIAMAFLVMGLAARDRIAIDDADMIATSFPGFAELMNALGAAIKAAP